MCIAVTLKRYRAVKDVGEIKMSVGFIAYYQLMQVCQVQISVLLPFVLLLIKFPSFGITYKILFSLSPLILTKV